MTGKALATTVNEGGSLDGEGGSFDLYLCVNNFIHLGRRLPALVYSIIPELFHNPMK
jgi:hypothetical protein